MAVLTVDSLSAGYGHTNVISNVSFSLETGLVVGLSGRNGAGKSTLFKAVLGQLATPFSQISMDNIPIPKGKRWQIIGHLPQETFLPGSIIIEKLPRLFLETSAQRNQVENNLRFQKIAKSRVISLSEGERRFLEILLILALDRPFFFLDEPFSRIDPLYVTECRKMILDRSGTAGILVTDHNFIDLKKVSHRRLTLSHGRIL